MQKRTTPWRRVSHRHVGPNLGGLRRRLEATPAANAPPLLTPSLFIWIGVALLAIAALLPFDGRISLAMLDEADGVLAFMRRATEVGLVRWYFYPLIAFIAIVSLVDWSSFARDRQGQIARLYAHGLYFLASVTLAGLITQIGKRLFGRARPELIESHGSLSFDAFQFTREFASFPSGHATTIGAVTFVLCVWYPTLRLPLLAAGGALALSRIVVREHYPADVVAGFTIGALVAILLARALARRGLLYAFRADGKGRHRLIPGRPAIRFWISPPTH